MYSSSIVFIDAEIGISDQKIHDLGAVRADNHRCFHAASIHEFDEFIHDCNFICGHNILHHDLKYIERALDHTLNKDIIDTLYLSPLLFPKRPYHALLKDDKLQTDELNNPLNDSKKAADLFYDEINAFLSLGNDLQKLICALLHTIPEFSAFFKYVGCTPSTQNIEDIIRHEFDGRFCSSADLQNLIDNHPAELAYALSLIRTDDSASITPPWLLRHYPEIENIIRILCGTPCQDDNCRFCRDRLNVRKALKRIFNFDSFRTYNGEPLQENAAQAAVNGKSLLAVFPTGGGKSLTFQLPALMAGQTAHGLTVVISPLQSLMKDQVDNLNHNGITSAVTVNGLLDPIERSNALSRVADGSASLLYISPEQLRSHTIERLLLSRNVVRFVIDEAHCFSAWGQDFRVDYMYIGDFIRLLQKQKQSSSGIPVSCFTATAKQKVITDICDYFKKKLNLDLEIFASSAARENLHYTVLYKESDEDKYAALRDLITRKHCPSIVYVSRTKRTIELAQKLSSDGLPSRPFNGKMDANEKIANQEAFMRNDVQVMVATSAFGMGVDKKDIKLVIHYDISSSLEDYVQEAGRAGRDPSMQAECYVLYNDNDLDKHFILLNQTKLSISEIQQVWKAIKDLTRQRSRVCCSPLEIARQAGWDDSVMDIEMRVKTAVAALENAGYVKRGRNVPHVYATSILVSSMQEASYRIDQSVFYSDEQRIKAKRIIKSLISSRSISKAGNDDAESRVDYLADMLAMTKSEVIDTINLLRQDGLLDDSQDMSAYIYTSDTENKSSATLDRFSQLEHFLLRQLSEEGCSFNLKQLNENAHAEGITSASVKNLRTLMYYLSIKNYIQKSESVVSEIVNLTPTQDISKLQDKSTLRLELCRFILKSLYKKADAMPENERDKKPVLFSLVGLFREYKSTPHMNLYAEQVSLSSIEDALLYLSKIGALKLEGGFLVLYNGMEINRLIADNRIKYKVDDYRFLDEFYKQKIRQIHIVGEYANLMVRDYTSALQYVQDYFQMDFRKFITKYFQGERVKDLDRNITPNKYHQLFDSLSDTQSQIINDADSKYIVVAAGPGSGKTRVLVHKLAALLLLEDVKHEQLLMLTFSRAAAIEFKQRLLSLIGNAANFVEIKTFHSYCFDLLGKIGNLEGAQNVVRDAAAALIRSGEVEQGKIIKSVLVIDEAQDMDADEFSLVQAIMQINDDMRVIAVGDDDQNIYEFRGSDSRHLRSLIDNYGAKKYELLENYRSRSSIVALGNAFVATIRSRMKSSPIQAVQSESGTVCITHHRGKYMAEAIVQQLIASKSRDSSCILTNTNEEALQILGLLSKNGVQAKLIQSMDAFPLYNLVEIRLFLAYIDKNLHTPTIPANLWNAAKEWLFQQYAGSPCLEICRNMFHTFETISPKKYRSDLIELVKEAHYEDFLTVDRKVVCISTIHKSKGREFDTVYMLLNGNTASSDEERRKLYVGMTRARNALFIHCNTDLFSAYQQMSEVCYKEDPVSYQEPQELTLFLTHRDVFLDYFNGKAKLIIKLRSGMPLILQNPYLLVRFNNQKFPVIRLSRACIDRIQALKKHGYMPCSAEIRFIVSWTDKAGQEHLIILPSLSFRKTKSNE